MDIIYRNLHDDVALKFDELIILGKEKVNTFIEENKEKFIELNIQPLDNSKMLYGYNIQKNPIKIGFKDKLIIRIIIITKPIKYNRLRATISFDGHLYNGFQTQETQKTIQGELSKIVSKINECDTLVQGASRTDRGVHAYNYVIHFDSIRHISNSKWIQIFNDQLPKDIIVKEVSKTHPLFHSRYDVYKKRYIYKLKINNKNLFKLNYEWNIKDVNLSLLETNLKQLIGTHDFTSFSKGGSNSPIRTIYTADYFLNNEELILVFEGDGFLRYMIRIIVHSLYLIASFQIDLSISELMNEKSREHTKQLAPASGLYLDKIYY